MSTKPAERVSDEASCACLSIHYDPRKLEGGWLSDRWACELCGNEFAPVAALRSPAEGAEGFEAWKATSGERAGIEAVYPASAILACADTYAHNAWNAARQRRPASPLPAELAAEVAELRKAISAQVGQGWRAVTFDGEVLTRILDALESRPAEDGWVSVEDRLPEIGAHVLLVPRRKRPFTEHPVLRGKMCDFGLRADGDGGNIDSTHYTHWRPLPPPPTEKADGGGK